MRNRNTGVVSSIPPCVTIKMPLVGKAMGNYLIRLTFIENAQIPFSGFCYALIRVSNAVTDVIVHFRSHPPENDKVKMSSSVNSLQRRIRFSIVWYCSFKSCRHDTERPLDHKCSIKFALA